MLRWVVVAFMVTTAAALHCYQCVSDSRDEEPLCDTDFWGQTTNRERHNMLTVCPVRYSAFCIKTVVVGSTYKHTSRGCFGARDDLGARLSEGCAVMLIDDIETTACFCSTHACNATNSLRSMLTYAVILAIVSGMLK